MDKEKLRKYIYYAALVLCAIILIVGYIIFQPQEGANEDSEAVRVYLGRRMITFYAFIPVLTLGIIIRELLGEYDKKKMIIKGIVMFLLLVIATLLFIFVQNSIVYNAIVIGGFAGFGYCIIPTIKPEENTRRQ